MVWRGSAVPGCCRGGTSGRSSLVDGGVRLIFEGLTSRPGVRRGSLSRSGRGRPLGPVARSSRREPRATVVGLPGARARPGSVPGAMVGVWSVKRGGLPAEGDELAGAGDRDDAGGLAALVVQVLPAGVQAPLGAPGDLDDAWVLAVLAGGERLADARRVSVVVGGPGGEGGGGGRPRRAGGGRGAGRPW